ncbi:MAG: hypothetical protein AB7O26_08845 [Planctomycetaceae bacterium]
MTAVAITEIRNDGTMQAATKRNMRRAKLSNEERDGNGDVDQVPAPP